MTAPTTIHTSGELGAVLSGPRTGRAVVMTMGALHEGHRALMREARKTVGQHGCVVVTIFVNPLQFGEGEDYEHYPRTLAEDLAACSHEGVDVVFAPKAEEIYPHGEPQVTVSPGRLGDELEGAWRPGHFTGVLTVVAKLLNLTNPGYAIFGEKDYQQLTLITRMAADLRFSCEVVGVPTVREADGLALSSRNAYLSPEERETAALLPKALKAGQDVADNAGEADEVLNAALQILNTPRITLDYLTLRTDDLQAALTRGSGRLLVAARVGATRLIDNVPINLSG